jgi:aspartate/methionine/tyrosine aminotransferase
MTAILDFTEEPHVTFPVRLAVRTSDFQESVIREMTRLGEEAGAVNLSQGLPDFEAPAEVLQAAVVAIEQGHNQYTFPFGMPEFRRAVAEKSAAFNGIAADPETEVTITCGVSEAVVAAILALTDPGDEAIILEPWYENYVPGCLMAGVTPRFVRLQGADFALDADLVQRAVNDRTRLLFINSPHNPTGRVFTHEELTAVADLCQRHNIIVVADEIYERIVYAGHEHVSIGSLPGMAERTVTISGLGKAYAVTGWRVGWATAAAPMTALIRKVHDYMTVCAPSPFQAAGIAALSLPQAYYREMRETYARGRDLLLAALDGVGIGYCRPQGAYYVMADVSSVSWDAAAHRRVGWSDDRAFAEYLARDVGVAVVPGSSFYADAADGSTRVRFNFAKKRETLESAAARLAQGLRQR